MGMSSQGFNSVQNLNGFIGSGTKDIGASRVYSNSTSRHRDSTEVGISREVEDLKSTLNRIQNNVSNNNSFEKENNASNNGNMILGGLKEKLHHNKEGYRPDLPQFPMKYKKWLINLKKVINYKHNN